MSETAILQDIHEELRALKADVAFIRNHMFDPDTIMSNEEINRFERSLKELKDGKTSPLSEIKKKLGL